jgi:hypothetical protein
MADRLCGWDIEIVAIGAATDRRPQRKSETGHEPDAKYHP